MLGEEPARDRIIPKALALYACFAGVTLLGIFVWEPLLMPAVFTWPYPFLLSAQHFIRDPAGATSWVAALCVGLALVAACAWFARRILAHRRVTSSQQWGIAILSVACPLGIVTGVTWAIASVAGWPIGE